MATVIMFICNHCPYVKHVNSELIRIARDFNAKGVRFIAISSNDASQYPEDGPEEMSRTAQRLGYPFPYLYDESQEVARAYDAACTPDLFVYDKDLILIYHGQIDGSRPGNNIPVSGSDLRMALENFFEGKPALADQKPSVGCSIKWKA
jgi:thiol-disulfide isomerase/thioredoxin